MEPFVLLVFFSSLFYSHFVPFETNLCDEAIVVFLGLPLFYRHWGLGAQIPPFVLFHLSKCSFCTPKTLRFKEKCPLTYYKTGEAPKRQMVPFHACTGWCYSLKSRRADFFRPSYVPPLPLEEYSQGCIKFGPPPKCCKFRGPS